MATLLGTTLVAVLACSGVVLASYLDEAALGELAELEGLQLQQRVRRQADPECRCPPPGPPPQDFEGGDRPPPPPPPPGPWHHRGHHYHHWGTEDYSGAACELRPLFRVPDKFNFTARVACFERWERDMAKQLGVEPEDRFDFSKYKPTQKRSLIWNKGCDMQCHFLELELLTEEDLVDAEAVAALIREEGDSSDITAAVDKAVESCAESAAGMVHSKQQCRSGADEMLFCLQRTIDQTCPGAKWQGQRSCDEVAHAASRLRACRMMRHMHPPPPFMRRPPFPMLPPSGVPSGAPLPNAIHPTGPVADSTA